MTKKSDLFLTFLEYNLFKVDSAHNVEERKCKEKEMKGKNKKWKDKQGHHMDKKGKEIQDEKEED